MWMGWGRGTRAGKGAIAISPSKKPDNADSSNNHAVNISHPLENLPWCVAPDLQCLLSVVEDFALCFLYMDFTSLCGHEK